MPPNADLQGTFLPDVITQAIVYIFIKKKG
jgi:hypothetical protein